MQDIHAIGGGDGRFLGGDRRLRPHGHQALKCPRCDSLNTKFCYYNNYNLSQPRHFCKNCRRYWTKGGVLRNVPLGGGCRKNKRSKPKTDSVGERKPNRSSSSENSSLTAATIAAPSGGESAGAVGESTAPANTTSNSTVLYNFPDSDRFFYVNPPSSDHHPSTDGQIFAGEIGSLTSLMTSSKEMMGFGMDDVQTQPYQGPGSENSVSGLVGTAGTVDEFKMQDMRGVSNDSLAAAMNWGGGGAGGDGVGDQGLFDLTAAVDPAYWSQTQWTDNDQSLYLP